MGRTKAVAPKAGHIPQGILEALESTAKQTAIAGGGATARRKASKSPAGRRPAAAQPATPAALAPRGRTLSRERSGSTSGTRGASQSPFKTLLVDPTVYTFNSLWSTIWANPVPTIIAAIVLGGGTFAAWKYEIGKQYVSYLSLIIGAFGIMFLMPGKYIMTPPGMVLLVVLFGVSHLYDASGILSYHFLGYVVAGSVAIRFLYKFGFAMLFAVFCAALLFLAYYAKTTYDELKANEEMWDNAKFVWGILTTIYEWMKALSK